MDESVQLFLDSESGNHGNLEEFLDPTIGVVQVLTDNEKQIGFNNKKPVYRMLGTKVNVINDNDRGYPKNVMTSAIQVWKDSRKGSPGEAGHPESYPQRNGKLGWRSKIENQVITVLDVHYPDSDGNVFFEFQTLDTQKGKDLQALIDQKVPVGCSMRAGGRGTKGKIGDREATIATYLDLYTFDILFDPALKDTLGSITEITDSEIESILDQSTKTNDRDFSDAVDPYIQRLKAAKTLIDTVEIKLEVDEVELDAIDRSAFDRAYYQRRDQLWEKQAIEREKNKESAKVGYLDQESEKGMDFEQLNKMTDEELKKVKETNPEFAAMCDAILGSRKTASQLQEMKDAEKKRKNKEEAEAFMDSDEVKQKIGKLPQAVQEKIKSRVDLTSKEKAEQTFNDAYEFAATFVADDKLKDLGFTGGEKMLDSAQGTINIEINEKPAWKEFTDKLSEATNDQYLMFQGVADENLIKMNKPIVDRLMKEFDKANEAKLLKFADDFNTSTNTSTVLNGVGFQRQIIEQAFQTMVALQFVQAQAFSGEFMEIPRENYKRSNNRPLNNGELSAMAKSKLSLDYIHVAAEARKLAAEITKEAKSRLESGPLNYNIMGRLAYHLANDLNRDTSLRVHEEMLRASDEYNAVKVEAETPDIDSSRTIITLLRGGKNGAPNKHVPIVKPRTTYYWTNSGKQKVVENEIVLRLDGETIDLSNAKFDYEKGTIILDRELGEGNPTVDYSYVTNIALFDLAVPDGVSAEKYFNKLIHLIGQQKALMGGEPRFYSPNFLLMSEGISNELSQAELFSSAFQKNGNELQPNGYVGKIKAINAYEHNEPWSVGDSRMLIGQRLATKYGVGTSMGMQGPFPTRDANSELTGGEEIYYFLDDAINTPVKQVYRTIKFFNSKA